jgi:hypothetical protein
MLRQSIKKSFFQYYNNRQIDNFFSFQNWRQLAMSSSAKNKRLYKSILNAFLSRRDGVVYDNDHVFPVEVIRAITEVDVLRWLRYKAYGK